MKKLVLTSLVLIVVVLSPGLSAGDNRPFDRAQRALKQKDYASAITICLDLLVAAPGDYDVNFLLVQAYARSGERNKALERLEKMDALFPGNPDVLLYMARIRTWKGQYAEALALYERVLEVAPGNEEALVGTADIAARRRDFARSRSILRDVLEHNPNNADAYYHLGLAEQWQGNRGQARESFEKAVGLAPENDDYKIFLSESTPRMQRKLEIRYGHEIEDWSDGRADFQNDRLALHLGLPRNLGVLILEYNQTRRFGETGRRFGLEAYPRLWAKAYGHFELGYSPEAVHYPRLSTLVEIYQGVLSAAEVSLGVWHMSFTDRPVTVGLGSLGWYLGNYYPYLRLNYASENGNSAFSWVLSLRRYFSADDYVYAGYGHGTRLLEDLTLQDLLPTPGNIYLAGAVCYLFKNVRIEFHFSRTTEPGLARNTVQVSTGYRWR
jgi:YaiO family outer membrane protein